MRVRSDLEKHRFTKKEGGGQMKESAKLYEGVINKLKLNIKKKDAAANKLKDLLLEKKTEASKYKQKAVKLQDKLQYANFELKKIQSVQEEYVRVLDTNAKYKQHFEAVHAQIECAVSIIGISNLNGSGKKNNENRTYECFSCKASFLQEFELKHHLKCSVCYDAPRKKYPCTSCEKIFTVYEVLAAHLVTHEPKKTFTGPEVMPAQLVANEPKKTFTKPEVLPLHLGTDEPQEILSDEESWICNVCEKKFILKSSFRQHIRSHQNANRHMCDECDKGFFQIADYTRHMRIHTGDRPFTCTHNGCEKKFTQQVHLVKHLATHVKNISPQKKSPNKISPKKVTPKKVSPYKVSPRKQ